MSNTYQELTDQFKELEVNYEKSKTGNAAAGVRTRKNTFAIEKLCKQLRKETLGK